MPRNLQVVFMSIACIESQFATYSTPNIA